MKIDILSQPDDETCGPTSLHAVYKYFNYNISLDKLIKDIPFLEEGGTLAVYLGIDALNRGFNATIYSYNLKVFDPTWKKLSKAELLEKIKQQKKIKTGKKFLQASNAYIHFLEKGGDIKFEVLTKSLLRKYIGNNIPILAGLSATYLYDCPREIENDFGATVYDDVAGKPTGHFVVLYKDNEDKTISVADPYDSNPINKTNYYSVNSTRLINSILLGILTYDANILIITPK